MRLQLIRYESVELTEQLMREKQKRRGEDDDSSDSNQAESREPEGESASEVQAELRGVLLEEQRAEEPDISTAEGGREGDMLYVLTKGLSQAGEDSVLMQLQDTEQQQGMLVD